MMTRFAKWFCFGCLFVSLAIVAGGALAVFIKQERCVGAVMQAKANHLSTWEAVERCQQQRPR